jgi:DnaJ-class molecular chaperone
MSKAVICPVCQGNGLRPSGFYAQTTGTWGASSTETEKCRSCDGKGYVVVDVCHLDARKSDQ